MFVFLNSKVAWKATDYKNFVFYCIMSLENVLDKQTFDNFCIFVRILSTLCKSKIESEDIDCAKHLVQDFFVGFRRIYPARMWRYNVHCLAHMGDMVEKFGPLYQSSAFNSWRPCAGPSATRSPGSKKGCQAASTGWNGQGSMLQNIANKPEHRPRHRHHFPTILLPLGLSKTATAMKILITEGKFVQIDLYSIILISFLFFSSPGSRLWSSVWCDWFVCLRKSLLRTFY